MGSVEMALGQPVQETWQPWPLAQVLVAAAATAEQHQHETVSRSASPVLLEAVAPQRVSRADRAAAGRVNQGSQHAGLGADRRGEQSGPASGSGRLLQGVSRTGGAAAAGQHMRLEADGQEQAALAASTLPQLQLDMGAVWQGHTQESAAAGAARKQSQHLGQQGSTTDAAAEDVRLRAGKLQQAGTLPRTQSPISPAVDAGSQSPEGAVGLPGQQPGVFEGLKEAAPCAARSALAAGRLQTAPFTHQAQERPTSPEEPMQQRSTGIPQDQVASNVSQLNLHERQPAAPAAERSEASDASAASQERPDKRSQPPGITLSALANAAEQRAATAAEQHAAAQGPLLQALAASAVQRSGHQPAGMGGQQAAQDLQGPLSKRSLLQLLADGASGSPEAPRAGRTKVRRLSGGFLEVSMPLHMLDILGLTEVAGWMYLAHLQGSVSTTVCAGLPADWTEAEGTCDGISRLPGLLQGDEADLSLSLKVDSSAVAAAEDDAADSLRLGHLLPGRHLNAGGRDPHSLRAVLPQPQPGGSHADAEGMMAQWDTEQSHSAAAGGQHQHTEAADTHNLVATLLRHHHHHHLRQPHQPAQQAEHGHHQEPAAAGPAAPQGAYEATSEHAQQQAPVNSSVAISANDGPACQAVMPEARQAAAGDEPVPSAPMWPGPASLPAPASEGEADAEVSAPSAGLAVTTAADILARHLEGAASRAVALAEDRRPHEAALVRVMLMPDVIWSSG